RGQCDSALRTCSPCRAAACRTLETTPVLPHFSRQALVAARQEKSLNARILDGEMIASRHDDARLYDGVRTRRIFAFLLDYLIVGLLLIPFAILVFLLGLLTFGLAWSLFAVLGPIV